MNTFQTWLELPEGTNALAAIRRVLACLGSGRKRRGINPLFLHGPPGSGKSHLIAALVEEAASRQGALTASVLPASDLTPLFRADAEGESVGMAAELRAADLLVVEDVQHLAPSAVEPLVQLLDYRIARQRQTVLTAIEGPGRLKRIPARLASRLASGLVVGLLPLSAESRLTFLKELALRRKLRVADDVLLWLSTNLDGSARQLEGALTRIAMLTRLGGVPPTLANIEFTFNEEARSRQLSVDQIATRVGRLFQVDPQMLQTQDRSRHVLLPRQVGMYLARKLTQMSLQQIGTYFGGRDHSTVLHACRKVEQALNHDPGLSGVVRELHAELS